MYLNILKKDLKRKKAMNIILLLFIILATMFVSSSVNNIINVTLTGNSIFGLAMSEDIVAYNKTHYSWDKDIEVEVIK